MTNLDNFSNEKLIDIVKNYKLFRYEEHIKDQALAILTSRGITIEDIQLLGDSGSKLATAHLLFRQFNKNSIAAFGIYILLFTLQFLINSWFLLGIFVVLLCLYFYFIITSFRNQHDFYSALDLKENATNALVFYFIGMPFYPIFYFYTKKGMQELLP